MTRGFWAAARCAFTVLVVSSFAATSARAAPGAGDEPAALQLAPALVNPELPAFGDDGSVVIKGTDQTGSYPRSEIEWIRPDGYATRWALPRELERDVQSLYIERGVLWLLLDDPTVEHEGAPPPSRRYTFARMSWDGLITRVVAGPKAAWPAQTDTSRSRDGIWARTGVYWTGRSLRFPQPGGLSWAAPDGSFHQPWNSPVPLRGAPDEALGVGPDGMLWTAVVSQPTVPTAKMREGLDGIARLDAGQHPPAVTEFVLPAQTWPAEIAADVAGGAWFSDYDGLIGHLSDDGNVANFAWHSGVRAGRRPSALVAAADGGVWTFDDSTARHLTVRGDVTVLRLPNFSDGLPAYGESIAPSACGVFWIRANAALWTWRPAELRASRCLEATAVKPASLRTARLAGF